MLYEREAATEAIARLLGAAAEGAGGSLLLVGNAGTGKTALLAEAVEQAQVPGPERVPFRVLRARGAAMEADLPFALADQLGLLISTAGAGSAWAASGEVDPRARRAAIYQAVRSHLEHSSQGCPVALVLDDLHWADPDTLDLVGFLARRLAGHPIALVGSLRPWPAPAVLLARSLAQGGHAEVLEISPLSERSSAALLSELVRGAAEGSSAAEEGSGRGRVRGASCQAANAGGLSDDVVMRSWLLTRGNPMLIAEAAQAVSRTGCLPEPGDGELASLQRTLLLSQLAGIGPDALQCASAAAVLRTPIRIGVLARVTAMSEGAFVDAFDTLVGAGVLRMVGPGSAEFSHDLLATAIYEDILPAKRTALHTRAFECYLGQSDAPAAAPHALAADLRGDDRGLEVLVDAGMSALRRGAVETGLGLLRAALGLGSASSRLEALVRVADGLFLADSADDALAVYGQILSRFPEPGLRIEVMSKAARAEAFAGDVGHSMIAYGEALEELSKLDSKEVSAPLAEILAERAHVAWEADGPQAALAMLDPSSSPIWPEPEPDALGSLRAYMRLTLGEPSGLDLIVRAANSGAAGGPTAHDAARSLNLFLIHPGALAFVERFEEAHELIARAGRIYRSVGSVRSQIAIATLRATILLSQGRPEEVLAEGGAVGEGDLLGLPRLAVMRAEALTLLGRVDESIAICGLIEGSGRVKSHFATFNLGVVRAQHLAAGPVPAEAAASYLKLEAMARSVGVASLTTSRWAAGAIEAALAAGRGTDALRIAAWLERANQSLSCTWPEMLALGARAGAASLSGDEGAGSMYLAALGSSHVMPLQRGAIALRYGSWLRRRGRIGQARQVLSDCLVLAERRGAASLATAARAELAAAGGRRHRVRDPSDLTAQESRVARMAADGAATREIAATMYLSPRTVETHLARVYDKLGVRSKAELRRRRADLGL